MVRVRGEISGFKRAASGHCYLCLKDDKAVLDGVIWRGAGGRAAAMAEDGLDVVASGRLTTYPGRSKYQIVIDRLELAGQGALMQLLETGGARRSPSRGCSIRRARKHYRFCRGRSALSPRRPAQ